MKKYALRYAGKKSVSVAMITVTMLLSSVLAVPSSNAYALTQNGNSRSGNSGFFDLLFSLFGNSLGNQSTNTSGGNSIDNQGNAESKGDVKGKSLGGGDAKNEKSDRKELKDQKEDNSHHKDNCKANRHGKYNKDCSEDQNGN